MNCLLKYQWVKLPRNLLPEGKGVMRQWAKLAAKAAFRSGRARYCGHVNDVAVGTWSGGIVGVKAILGTRSKKEADAALTALTTLGYIDLSVEPKTRKLTYSINDYVVKCSGEACSSGTIYASDGYGFLCLPRSITQRLVESNHIFEDADAWLDLWCHTVSQDPRNAFSRLAPTVQFGKYGTAITLETLGARWRWEKTKVWRFFQRHLDTFSLHKLPGSFGCLIFNKLYPTDIPYCEPSGQEIIRILDEIRIYDGNTHNDNSDNAKINRLITWYSSRVSFFADRGESAQSSENRVALSGPIYNRVYISLWSCKNCLLDCKGSYKTVPNKTHIRGPSACFTPSGGVQHERKHEKSRFIPI